MTMGKNGEGKLRTVVTGDGVHYRWVPASEATRLLKRHAG